MLFLNFYIVQNLSAMLTEPDWISTGLNCLLRTQNHLLIMVLTILLQNLIPTALKTTFFVYQFSSLYTCIIHDHQYSRKCWLID